jgi:large subunit ribosomal protein L13
MNKINPAEHVIDAKDQSLGRVAARVAVLLQGKDKAAYEPREIGDVRVVVKNVKAIRVTGKKAEQKIYYRHSGPIGHLKERKFSDVFSRRPEWVLRHAVGGMLPKNTLRAKRLKNLVIEL